jgi:glutamyl-tRNA reductase
VISDRMIRDLVSRNREKKLLIADMAIPRDVELEGNYPGIEYYNLDDVKEFVKSRQHRRERAIPEVEEIIDRRLDQFIYWFDHVRHEPIYNGLGDTFEKIRRQEISKLLESLPDDSHDIVDRATRRLVERLLQVKARTSATSEKREH